MKNVLLLLLLLFAIISCKQQKTRVRHTQRELVRKDGMWYFPSELDSISSKNNLDIMENKQLKITPPAGYEIDKENSTFECIQFKKVTNPSWESFNGYVSGYYINSVSEISTYHIIDGAKNSNKNIWPTLEEAEACLALSQLCQWRDKYNDGWKPDFNRSLQNVFTIRRSIKYTSLDASAFEVTSTPLFGYRNLFCFKTKEIAERFLKDFGELLNVASPLLL